MSKQARSRDETGTVSACEPLVRELRRRTFLKLGGTATLAGIGASSTMAQESRRGRGEQEAPPPPLNALSPAAQFQAAPGGTGAYLASLEPADAAPPEIPEFEGEVPARDEDLAFLPVHRQAALLRAGEITPVDLTEIYLDRLRRHDERLMFTVQLLEESAMEEARRAEAEIDEGRWRGPLHGIPYGLKDLFSARGTRTTWGARPFEHRVIDEDATVVTRLREAGAILAAKLATGTFAMGDQWFRGRTRNPWNPEQGSSGSSAGPASATAAGCVGFAIGTETLGSIVSPARRCSLTALRPTFGRVSRHGGMTLAWSMDKVGPFARTVEDCAWVFQAIHGADPRDPSTLTAPFHYRPGIDLSQLRIGYAEGSDEAFLDVLRSLGAKPAPVAARPSSRSVRNVLSVESAAAFDDFVGSEAAAQMGGRSSGRFTRGREVSAVDYLNDQRRRLQLMHEMDEFFADLDFYLSPSGDLGLTNLTGHPTLVLPSGAGRGQPETITLVGRLFSDDLLLSAGHAVQGVTDWHLRRPNLG